MKADLPVEDRTTSRRRRTSRVWCAALLGAISTAVLVSFGVPAAEAGEVPTNRSPHVAGTTGAATIGMLATRGQPSCSATGEGSPTASTGYLLAGSDGSVYSCGNAPWYGSLTSEHIRPDGRVVGIAACGNGYWLATSTGAVYSFGQNPYLGRADGTQLNSPVVGITAAICSGWYGYWLVTSDGAVINFGVAGALGSAGNIQLNRALVGMAATPEPLAACYGARLYCYEGYWLAAADGGIFTYSSPGPGTTGYYGSPAYFLGSTGCLTLNQPIVGLAASPDTTDVGTGTACHSGPESPGGYWMVASDGGIFAFGNAPFLGSTGCIRLDRPVVGMIASPDMTTVGESTACIPGAGTTGGPANLQPGGYMMVASDGGVFTFGNATFAGSLPGSGISVDDIVGVGLSSPH